jgi:membrane-associated phospholipid phosphatase
MKFYKENQLYFIGLFGVLLTWQFLMFTTTNEEITLILSKSHEPMSDTFFAYATRLAEGFAYVGIAFLLGLIIKLRHMLVVPLMGLTTTVVVFFLKDLFSQPRPAHVFSVSNRIADLSPVEGHELLYSASNSFPSGHATAAFALFGYLAFISQNKLNKMMFLSVAVLVAISRVYLLQHFLRDVYAGAAIGTLIAMAFYYVQNNLVEENKSLNKSLVQYFSRKSS